MNKVILTGYVATDVELRHTSDGTAVATANIAVRRPRVKDKTDFFTCNFWRATAEHFTKYFKKGSGIEVTGVLITRTWEDQEGNKRYATEVNVEEIDFGKKSKDETSNEPTVSVPPTSNAGYNPYPATEAKFEEIPTDDSLPF